MKVMIVYGREPDVNVNQLIKASNKLGFETIPAGIMDLSAYVSSDVSRFFVKDREITGLQVCFIRSLGPGTHEQISRRTSFMEHLELSGTFVVNPVYAFRRARDKYATMYTLAKAGLPIPKTFVTENALRAYRFAKRSTSIVCKPMIGSMGYGVMRFEDLDLAYNAFRLFERINQPIYVQEFIQKPGKDIRAFVIGDQVLAAIHRIAPFGHWKTNIAQGGKAKAVKLTREIKELAIKSTQVLGLEYAGVDLVETSKGPIILEVNSSPSWQGLQQTTGKNIAEHLIKHVTGKAAS
jgi:ribosomal protein S6--L-glutamate ligase